MEDAARIRLPQVLPSVRTCPAQSHNQSIGQGAHSPTANHGDIRSTSPMEQAMEPGQSAESMQRVEYLGDGLYVYRDAHMVWLVTGNHLRPDNRVALEVDVLENFLTWVLQDPSLISDRRKRNIIEALSQESSSPVE